MAHALKYFKEITMADGRTVRLELYATPKPNQIITPKEIGPVMQTFKLDIQGTNNEIDSPIVKTSLTMAFADAPDHPDHPAKKCGNWEEFYTPSSTAWKVILKAKDVGSSVFSTIWGGYVTPDSFSETLQYRGTVTITARDNIGHMQDFMFDAPGDADGMISLRDLIEAAWAKIESPMELLWLAGFLECDGVDATDTLMNVSAFEGKNWYEAAEAALYSYGLVMRYIGNNQVQVVPLRYLPYMFYGEIDQVPHETPTFLAHADRELSPAARRIEETVDYELEAGKQAPLGDSLDFTGELEDVTFEGESASGQVQLQGVVHPIANTSDIGWGNVKAETLFCNPHLYHIDDVLSSYRNSTWIAGCTAGDNEVWYGSYFYSGSMRIEMIFGPPARIVQNADFEKYGNQYQRVKNVTVAVSKDKNGIREYWNGEQWQATEAKLTLEVEKAELKASVDISFSESGRTLIQLHIYDFELVNRFVPSSGAPGVYIPLASLTFTVQESSLAMLETAHVNTVYDNSNNVIISRDPELGPAMDTPIFPSVIRNGIFYRSGVNIYPAKAWSWPGGTPQQMAVYNHLQLLCYYSKPNNVLSGTIVDTDLTRIATIWEWGGAEHLLVSGSFDFLNDRIDGAVLREFARYDDMWGDVPDTNLPEVQEQSRTNIENGSSSSSQTSTYTNTTTVNIGGSGGTSDHEQLENRDRPDQHPMTAITGLLQALEQAGLFEITPDGLAVTPKNGLGIVTPSFISAMSANPMADIADVGGLDADMLWLELADQNAEKALEKQINASHLTDALASYATQAYVTTQINALIGGAPSTLDTLKEIADAIAEGGTAMDALVVTVGEKASQIDLDAALLRITAIEGDYRPMSNGDFTNIDLVQVVNLTATGYISCMSSNAQADIASTGGLDTDAMWLELRTASSDPLKVIDVSHIPNLTSDKLSSIDYLVSASVDGNTLTLTPRGGDPIQFTPSGGSSGDYLPLTGGTITGVLAVDDINSVNGNGLLAYHPADWTGVESTEWGVGTIDGSGVIRTSNGYIYHYINRTGEKARIIDSNNLLSYLRASLDDSLPITECYLDVVHNYAGVTFDFGSFSPDGVQNEEYVTIPTATQSKCGFMSAEDKKKLDSMGTGGGGFDEAMMWTALDAANEVIDASHIPDISHLNGFPLLSNDFLCLEGGGWINTSNPEDVVINSDNERTALTIAFNDSYAGMLVYHAGESWFGLQNYYNLNALILMDNGTVQFYEDSTGSFYPLIHEGNISDYLGSGGSVPLASSETRGGIKLGFSDYFSSSTTYRAGVHVNSYEQAYTELKEGVILDLLAPRLKKAIMLRVPSSANTNTSMRGLSYNANVYNIGLDYDMVNQLLIDGWLGEVTVVNFSTGALIGQFAITSVNFNQTNSDEVNMVIGSLPSMLYLPTKGNFYMWELSFNINSGVGVVYANSYFIA